MRIFSILFTLTLICTGPLQALQRPDIEFKIFQFPKDRMPVIDGQTGDWDIVGPAYTYRTDLLNDTEDGHGTNIDRNDLDVSVRLGWVKDLNRIYVLYEATDDYWDFGRFDGKGYMNDIFEIVVDADLSGGPFIYNDQIENDSDNYLQFSGAHAQNYHIHTPPANNQWGWSWGGNGWIDKFPWAHQAYNYNFEHGDSGKLTLEFWITPFDHAPAEGPDRAIQSTLVENCIIGFAWSILDFDGGERDGHYNLAHDVRMVRDGSYLCKFRLMPLEPQYQPKIESRWTWRVIDADRRLVYFKDESTGAVNKRTWHFGNGDTSTEQYPVYQYDKPGRYTVWLDVEGPDGTSRTARHKEVIIK
jgi:hypothetical protein